MTDVERVIIAVCRDISGSRIPIGPQTRINFDFGITGDDGDLLIGELISRTGLAIGPSLQVKDYFGMEGIGAGLIDWIRDIRIEPLTVRELASGLIDDRALAAEQLAALNQFWRQKWTLPDQGSSSTSQ